MKKGFTLVELSIVLVIIGLLIGGILVAQSMIEATGLQKMGATANQLHAAIKMFKDNTGYYPGDAPHIWFVSKCSNYGFPGAGHWIGGCQTNSNGDIDTYSEWELATAHLSWMGYLDKEYTKYETGAVCVPLNPGVDSVDVGFNAGMNIYYGGGIIGTTHLDNRIYSLHINYASGDCTKPAVLTVPQSVAIDKKFDDGKPFGGDIVAGHNYSSGWSGNNCVSGGSYDPDNPYNISMGDTRSCFLAFSQPLYNQ
ncbi:MAG: hypothetical protein COV36_08245 [Alphaproteobacteria bacterium CG11_big_fil_rev_8_21_14_0_20_44_7]|nr:MAG: hypothetical protein COV36_08245 [Alphaproteobacteria bacterium CG11_big_fil_rev_8_21_14_0_20_44_7]